MHARIRTTRAAAGVRTVAALAIVAACASPPGPPTVRGSDLVAELADLSLRDREERIRGHVDRGGAVPPFLTRFVPIRLTATIDGRVRTATVHVAPDYFGLGIDADWLRLPITPQLAQHVADAHDCVLPTPRIVDAIWAQASTRVEPRPFHPRDHDILSLRLFAAHHRVIETQRGDAPPGVLLAGHKKDVVLSALLRDWPNRVVIYGWHRHPARAPHDGRRRRADDGRRGARRSRALRAAVRRRTDRSGAVLDPLTRVGTGLRARRGRQRTCL
jgi:hypothetical protein